MLKASCYSSQYCFTFFCSFSWRLTESACSTIALPIAMHRQACTLFFFTYAKIPHVSVPPILHKYNTYVTDPQAFMPASAWHSCRDAALFPNYFGQTCMYWSRLCMLVQAVGKANRKSNGKITCFVTTCFWSWDGPVFYSWDRASPRPLNGFSRSTRHTTCFGARMCLLGVPLSPVAI